MNWTKLKRDYPNSYEELKKEWEEFDKKDGYDNGSIFMRNFLITRGYNAYPSWIGSLRDYEKGIKGEFHV